MENNSYNGPDKIRPAIIGGSVMAIISTVPYLNWVNCLCCAGIILGGIAAVYFYQKSLPSNEPLLKTKHGLILGAFAGVFGAILETFITVLTIKFFASNYFDTAYIEMERFVEQMQEENAEVIALLNQVQDTIAAFAQEIAEHGYSLVLTIIILVFNTFKNVLFGLLGGLLGVAILQKKSNQQPNNPNDNNITTYTSEN
jgi:hypothetical protein